MFVFCILGYFFCIRTDSTRPTRWRGPLWCLSRPSKTKG